jgi:SAM-dependent methyltransferase
VSRRFVHLEDSQHMTTLPPSSSGGYTSSNLRKHLSANPVQRWLIARFHRTVAAMLAHADPGMALDAGCGEGLAIRDVVGRRRIPVFGLDGNVDALRVAKQLNPDVRGVAGDLLHLPFPDGTFDIVLCLEVLEHLGDPRAGLAELCRVSRRWLLLSVPNEPFFMSANLLRARNVRAWGNDPGHVNHWSSKAFERFVEQRCRVRRRRTSFPWTIVLAEVR